ncbi:MAG: hypothetical protein AAFQ82_22700, partial [Myxococcota bacterium]
MVASVHRPLTAGLEPARELLPATAAPVQLASFTPALPEREELHICDATSAGSPLDIPEVVAPCLEHIPSLSRYGSSGAVLREEVTLSADQGVAWAGDSTDVGVLLRVARGGFAQIELSSEAGHLIWQSNDGPSPAALAVLERMVQVYGEHPAFSEMLRAAAPLEENEVRWVHRNGEIIALMLDNGRLIEANPAASDLAITDPVHRAEEFEWRDIDGDGRIGGTLTDGRTEAVLLEERIRARLSYEQMIPAVRDFVLSQRIEYPTEFSSSNEIVELPFEAQVVIDGRAVRLAAPGEEPSVAVQSVRLRSWNSEARLTLEHGSTINIPRFHSTIAHLTRPLTEALEAGESYYAQDWQQELAELSETPSSVEGDGYHTVRMPLAGGALVHPALQGAHVQDATWLRIESDVWEVGGAPGYVHRLSDEERAALGLVMGEEILAAFDPS